jgi:thymidylate synthase
VHFQLSRQPFTAPQLNILRKPESLFDYEFNDFALENYQCHPGIKAAVAV